MEEFKTHFNPVIAVFRALFLLLIIGVICFFIFLLVTNSIEFSSHNIFVLLFFLVLCGSFFYIILHALIKSTKSYRIKESGLDVYNIITLTLTSLDKNDIKGFSTSVVPYRIWNFKQITIYIKDGRKFELMQFEFFNFKKISESLIERNYEFLGQEPYIWKWFDSRVYKYE